MTIVSICGFQGSGKDTIANYLISEYGFVKISFAGAIKDIASVMFGWDRQKLEGLTKEDREWRETVDPWWEKQLNLPISPRYIMQQFGTELFRRHFHPDIWVKVVEKKLTEYENVVITDCRFPNEIKMVKDNGGILIHVERNLPHWFHHYKSGNNSPEADKLHVSETSWIREKFDLEVKNNGSVRDLENKVEKYIMELSK